MGVAQKSANVVARIEPEIKEQAESILAEMGISASLGINMFYHQIIRVHGLPFTPTAKPAKLKTLEEMTDKEFDYLVESASYFDSAYDKCSTIPPMIDARFIADYTGINDMTLREVNDYEFETDIDEFPDD